MTGIPAHVLTEATAAIGAANEAMPFEEAQTLARLALTAGGAALLRDMADRIDRGPASSIPPSVISALFREQADDLAAQTP